MSIHEPPFMSTRVQWIAGISVVAGVILAVFLAPGHGINLSEAGRIVERVLAGEALENQARWAVLAAIAIGTLVSEDLACIAAGLLAGTGRLDYPSAVAASFSGIFIGDTIIYSLGYFFGRPVLRQRWMRWIISERAVNRAQHLFRAHGIRIVLLTRFIPGTRTATYFSAGALHAPPVRFIAVFALAAALWTPLLVGLSYHVGRRLLHFYDLYEAFALPALVLAGLVLYLVLNYIIPLSTWRGRRRLRGKWLRATRWEYWPAWQVYWRVVLHVLQIGLVRHRRLFLFTAVNPCMPHGGVLGESKADILRKFPPEADFLPAWRLIPPGPEAGRMAAFRGAMRELGLRYPVILKPDEGQRGLAVKVVRDEGQARAWFQRSACPGLLQEFVAGNEYGIFYIRHPGEPAGRVFSIAAKEQLEVVGNGIDPLDILLHRHPRAIAQLDLFLDRFEEHLERIPAEGERITLGELGTHALGSVFLDRRDLWTEALEARIDAIAQSCPEFYFGRLDLKVPDEAALQAGRGIRVLEVNGLTSEAAHIYDPGTPLFVAWGTLCYQWRTAFEIGEANRRRGRPVSRAGDFFRDVLAARSRQRRFGRS